jgi:FkbM family methyltransferase
MLKTTRIKVYIAHLLYKFVRIFKRNTDVLVTRRGIKYSLDLTEGIDLSVYISGGFQNHLFNPRIQIKENDSILDVGANCGVISLNFAKRHPKSTVYSFEPTDFAFNKLLVNLELNKDTIKNVIPVKAFISDSDKDTDNFDIYSSWKVDNIDKDKVHPTHMGIKKSATNVPVFQIDTFVNKQKIEKVGFIKIDTDGYEWGVLNGAAETIKRDRPYLIFEVGAYLLEEKHQSFESFIEYFHEKNYSLFTSDFKTVITLSNYKNIIPKDYTIDVFAMPEER